MEQFRLSQRDLTLRAQISVLKEIYKLLEVNSNRFKMFSETCFGSWLKVAKENNDSCLINFMVQHEDYSHHTECEEIHYRIDGYNFRFGKNEFCLVTGFLFGPEVRPQSQTIPLIKQRVFGKTPEICDIRVSDFRTTLVDLNENKNISDEDAVRVCLIVILHSVFLGSKPNHIIDLWMLHLVENLGRWNQYPWGSYIWRKTYKQLKGALQRHSTKNKKLGKYTLYGFTYALKIWMLETFPRCQNHFKNTPSIPRAVGWTRRSKIVWNDCLKLTEFNKRKYLPITALEATIDKERERWWIQSKIFISKDVHDEREQDDLMVDVDEDNDVSPSQPRKSFAGQSSQPSFAGNTSQYRHSSVSHYDIPISPWRTEYDGCYIPQPETQYNNFLMDDVPCTPARPAYVPCEEEHSPSLPVQCEDPLGKREIKPSRFHMDPWTMLLGKKHKGKTRAVDASNTYDITELYHGKRLPAWMPLSVLYKWKVEPSFWGTLLGEENEGFLTTPHINAWSRYLLIRRQPTDRWTIMPAEWVERLEKADVGYKELKKYGDGTEKPYPSWRDVDRVFFAINIPHTHWVTAELDMRSWHLTIYDTMPHPSLQSSVIKSINTVQNKLNAYLDRIKYFKGFKDITFQCPNLVVRCSENVPQQSGSLGDCGVFFCMFVEQLSEGQVVSCSNPTDFHAMLYRKRLANILYATRVK